MGSSELTPELTSMRDEIRTYAVAAGLDFFEVIFEVLDWNQINAVAAYGGFPNRYPHWRFGMEYEQISKSYAYGLSKIYEMVINNDPCYAYLLHSNKLVDQKMVMAHVYGHSDFFKNNLYFAGTNRHMMDVMGNHRTKIQRLIHKHGLEKVEEFIDVCLSLENLIDHRNVGQTGYKKPDAAPPPKDGTANLFDDEPEVVVHKLPSKDYMDKFINPREFLDHEKKKLMRLEEEKKLHKIPEHPERDVLLFLIEYAPMEKWERDILGIIRDEAYYFAPQAQTKIMNEGWAAYHHSQIMTTKALKGSELIDYADHHSGTVAPHPGQINPYKLGMELFRHIEDRWNKGKFGSDYENCDDMRERLRWDKKLGLGRKKIFEVRKLYNDVTFLDAFLDEEFCKDQKLFSFARNQSTGNYEISSRELKAVKSKLLQKLSNRGNPRIDIMDANAFNRSELTLRHDHENEEGADLRLDWAWETLRNLHRIWKRPVHLETIVEGHPKVLSFDGREKKEDKIAKQ